MRHDCTKAQWLKIWEMKSRMVAMGRWFQPPGIDEHGVGEPPVRLWHDTTGAAVEETCE